MSSALADPLPLRPIHRLLVANRGEIAVRVMHSAAELGVHTVAVYTAADRNSRHRFVADEAHEIGQGLSPVAAYLDIDSIVAVAVRAGVDAIHPGYGFLAENPDLAEAAARAGIRFVGPDPEVMRSLGSKVAARTLAAAAGVPTVPATPALSDDEDQWREAAETIGYPLVCKASWGGGGRGMRIITRPDDLIARIREARAEAAAAFGNGEVYLERLVERARHIEVQVLGDTHGTVVHLFERDCSVQRRHQKVVELAPSTVPDEARAGICEHAVALARAVGYTGAGTVEFLYDEARQTWYFIEVNPRIQVEHTITEQITGIDIVRAQLSIAQGGRIGAIDETGVPAQEDIEYSGYAIQCRITTEDPANGFMPSVGTITAYRAPSGPGVRVDAATAYPGATIGADYDSLLQKVIITAADRNQAVARARRALDDTVIAGVATNIGFLQAVLSHPDFETDVVTTSFLDDHPELVGGGADPVAGMLEHLASVRVNGHSDLKGRSPQLIDMARVAIPPLPLVPPVDTPEPGTRQRLAQLGAAGFASWMRDETRLLVTDTTLRDAHQSLLATRLRTRDIVDAAPAHASRLPGLLSLECWGGATFDVALRFLGEDPWDRLHRLRSSVPNVLLQMLLRGANAVGYTSYPDNVVRFFIQRAADAGIDVFRVFDSLNIVDNMRLAIDAVLETGRLCEGTICYTGDLGDPDRPRYNLDYYLRLARQLEDAGCHVLAIKDMAGVCRPAAARTLITALRETVGLPVHLHTHDTSGFAGATLFAAAEAGVDAVDAAVDAMSGLTSQPALGSLVRVLERHERDTGLDPQAIAGLSAWWEATRRLYAPFESDMRAGTGDVYRHEMPGGQYTNLREQARGIGIGDDRWPEVTDAFTTVNRLFGDIPKVTPSSKVVGDMALLMVSAGLDEFDVLDPAVEVPFPDSVVGLFRGDLGIPPGGFPPELHAKVLGGAAPVDNGRPGAALEPADLDSAALGFPTANDLASHLMYPALYDGLQSHRDRWGDLSPLPTKAFYFGLEPGDAITVEADRGRQLHIESVQTLERPVEGTIHAVFRVNGEPHTVVVQREDPTQGAGPAAGGPIRAVPGRPGHAPAPLMGTVVTIHVEVGTEVAAGDPLCVIEAMKMQTTISAPNTGTVTAVHAELGAQVSVGDLLIEIDPQ